MKVMPPEGLQRRHKFYMYTSNSAASTGSYQVLANLFSASGIQHETQKICTSGAYKLCTF
jgi:hypothetical protein